MNPFETLRWMTTPSRTVYGIDWKHCHRAVYRVQSAILKAWQAKDRKEVYRLQHVLVRMFEARALAVKRVRARSGSKRSGREGEVWDSPEALLGAIASLRDLAGYAPSPRSRGAGPRGPGPGTAYDRAVQTLAAFALAPIAEATADARSYGYRPHKSAHDAAGYLKLALGAPYSKRWVVKASIGGLSGSRFRAWAATNIPMDRKVLAAFLDAGFMELPRRTWGPWAPGAPRAGGDRAASRVWRGSVIAPVIATMALDGLEGALGDRFLVVRYVDEVVVLGKARDALVAEALPAVARFLAARGLRLVRHKTAIASIEDGFDVGGFTFREYANAARAVGYKKGIFLVTPSKAAVKGFKKRLKAVFKDFRHRSARALIVKVNPMVRAWADYYRSSNASPAFASVRWYVQGLILAWCRKKHLKTARRVLWKRYFTRVKGNRWVFYARTPDGRRITLAQLGATKIVYHTVCRTLNPFLPEHAGYYRSREVEQARRSVLLNAQRTALLKKRGGICPVCDTALLGGEPLEVHHITPRSLGGKDTLRNLLLLHRTCHQQVTYSKNTRLRAAWVKGGVVAGA